MVFRTLESLETEIAALKEHMQRLSDGLACALDVIEGDDPAWTEKFVRRNRALIVPESERVAYSPPTFLSPPSGEAKGE